MSPLMGIEYALDGEAWLRDRDMPLTTRERDILTRMVANPEDIGFAITGSELVYARGGGWWFGTEKVNARVAWSLIYRAYVTQAVGRADDDYRAYVINGDGKRAVEGSR